MKELFHKIYKSKIFKIVYPAFSLAIPYFKGYVAYAQSKNLPNDYVSYLKFRLGFSNTYWAKDKTCLVANPRKIFVGICSKVGRPGSYIQGAGKVYIGNYVRFAPNVGILSSNHDLYDRDIYNHRMIKIGDYCWIGMNSVILSGVELGENTIVGAGAVVTKSFPGGHCVIAGNPAKIIKQLDKNLFKPWHYPAECQYYGYIPKDKFEKLRKKYLSDEL